MGNFVRHTSCEKCGSSDANAIYDDGSSHCFACEATVPSQEFLDSLDGKQSRVRAKPARILKENTDMEVKVSNKPVITKEQLDQIKEISAYIDEDFRGVRKDTYTEFNVRHSIDYNGDVCDQYYPVTQEGQIVGVKIREVPKNFRSMGRTGADCELFMQSKFNRGGKYIVITEGELDALSAYQMLNDYNKRRGSPFVTAVVSPTTGANSYKQIAAQYKFLDSFDHIIICFDNDKAGKESAEELVKYLPKGKVKMMKLNYKDPNEYLENEDADTFVRDFYNAEVYRPVGVLGSGELYERILAQAEEKKLPFPPFMPIANEMTAGGLPLGHIINIAAKTGIGKTALVNELIYFWIFNSPYKIGIVSMELNSGQYGEVLLSRHMQRKLSLIREHDDKMKVLKQDATVSKATELFKDENDNDRFYLLDNRDGSLEEIQDTVEELIVSCGCRIIVLDPLQDVLDGLSNEDQAVFMKWAKGVIKSHNVMLIFINHMRKTEGGAHDINEEDIQGSSTIIKSASMNIFMTRDKTADDPVERNTTKVKIPKNRVCGITGPADELYYDNETHTLYNKEDYFRGRT